MDTIMPDDANKAGDYRPDFKALPRERLERMEAAGAEVLECYRVLRKTNDNIVGEVLRHQGTFYQWQHYPSGDVFESGGGGMGNERGGRKGVEDRPAASHNRLELRSLHGSKTLFISGIFVKLLYFSGGTSFSGPGRCSGSANEAPHTKIL